MSPTAVRIHIDRQELESPNPTTGMGLYALGNVPADRELFREVTGDREDEAVPRTDAAVHLTRDEHFYSARDRFNIEIVYGVNKPLAVHEEELIGHVKVKAMALFDIPASDKENYVLRAKVDGVDKILHDHETVDAAKLHSHQKVTLAAKAPYGRP